METILKTYFEQQFREQQSHQGCHPAPVVTISREFGCQAKLIAMMMTEALNKKNNGTNSPVWKFINKEIVEEVAFVARRSEFVDQKSGVSARLTISLIENIKMNFLNKIFGNKNLYCRNSKTF